MFPLMGEYLHKLYNRKPLVKCEGFNANLEICADCHAYLENLLSLFYKISEDNFFFFLQNWSLSQKLPP